MEHPKKVTAIIKVTENCNYNCSFCYYAYKKNSANKNMSIDLCKEIIKKTVSYNIKNNTNTCNIIFHGGEPLLRGIDFYKSVMNYEEELVHKYPNLIFDNTIQTNGSLINDEWINFFKKNNFIVGISLDGDFDLNYHKNSNGKSVSVMEILDKYHKMEKSGINVGILSVITNDHCINVSGFYNFIKNNNIKKISILPCVNDDNDFTILENNMISFYKEFFDLFYNGEYEFSVREFNDAIKRILGYGINTCKNCHRIACGTFLTFDCAGNVFFCDEAYNKNKIICNIKNVEISEIFDTKKYVNMKNECMDFYNNNCLNCDVKNICAGDCYRNDTYDNNGVRKNRFCNVSKIVYKYIENVVTNEDVDE